MLSQSTELSVITFLSGIFIDLDHFLDFFLFSGEKFSIKNVISWCEDGRWERVSLIFHSYELYIVLGVITYYFPHNILIGIMLGVGLHLLLDQFWNCNMRKRFRLAQWFYFLTYRASVGFHRDRMRIEVG